MAGRLLRRPSATSTASGKARKLDSVASITVSGRPPHKSVRTGLRPNTPPPMRVKNTVSTTAHSSTSQRFQNQRMQLSTRPSTMVSVATSGRHCSSKG